MRSDKPPSNRKVIACTCVVHGGTPGFTNLVVTKRGGDIELDPHGLGCCVVVLNEAAANQLFDAFGGWLG